MNETAAKRAPLQLPRLPAPVPRSGVSSEARQALRQLMTDAERTLEIEFRDGRPVEDLVFARAELVSQVVKHIWIAWVGGDNRSVALLAVGGFGRAELFPFSDVDLLVLTTDSPQPALLRAIEAFFASLWDTGLKPGHAVRTIADCVAMAAVDNTVMTGLLETRSLAGSSELEAQLMRALDAPDIWPPLQYFASKRAEQAARHARFNDTAYNLEPNLKEGPGGLRSLQLLVWFGRRLFGAASLDELAAQGWLTQDEHAALLVARHTLWRDRYALHRVAKRAEERLLFDYQRELARQLGYQDEHAQNLGVEQFMQDYFRAALTIERTAELVQQRFEEALDADAEADALAAPQRLSLDFVSRAARIETDSADLFLKRPAALIDLFRVWIENPAVKGLSATMVRRVQDALATVGPRLATDSDVHHAFLRLLKRGAPAVKALAHMNRYGVLAQFVPAFGRVVGRMQYDLFHVYTVDEHTLRVLRFVARFAHPEGDGKFELAERIYQRIVKPELLILAAMFHDIAKGRGGDHSELGEVEAREFCQRLGLPEADTELVAWLVRWHLIMSVTAQRQDITNVDVVHAFATQVADWERLDYLYLLTVADICGTSPKLWNSWKDRLLSDLYTATRFALRQGLAKPPHARERSLDGQRQALELLAAEGISPEQAGRVWADFPSESFLRYRPEQIAWQTAAIARTPNESLPLILVEPAGTRGCTEVFVYSPDRDGLFATVTAVLDRLHLNVLEARVVNSGSGISLDTFLVLDHHDRALDAEAATAVAAALRRALAQNPLTPHLARRTLSRSLRHFPMPTRIAFEQDLTLQRTQVALVCSDRPGLLASVAQAFRERHVRVHDARIATFGERVEDFFQITDENNRPLLEATELELLRAALIARLDNPLGETPAPGGQPKENHASA